MVDPDPRTAESPAHESEERSVAKTIARSVKIALLVLGLLVAGIALVSWVNGDTSTLPFDYEGFD